MPEQVKVEDKVAMLDMGKKLKARIEIGRKSGDLMRVNDIFCTLHQ